ncbi:hypothetical protein BCR39DRAFT_540383 [Naematelia encephala]|uniref:Uncharacterized protein n=1 Tax=Naematelia encephala TaxID=71784 RepID=A0A1Y2AW06_9TREE|nr:hypothetical protein BCR39DRAFT_540383 [Naematelia encephala]
MTSRLPGGPRLTLQHFVLQSEFIHAYRSAVRATRPLPDSSTRRETLDWLRSDLERLRSIHDLDALNTNLSHFNRTVKIMLPQLGLSGLDEKRGAKLVGQRREAWQRALGL